MSRYKPENVAIATKGKVSTMVCFGTMEEVVRKHIVNAINLEEIKATVMEIIFKNKARGPEVTGVGKVEK